jgi:hypothetical protein
MSELFTSDAFSPTPTSPVCGGYKSANSNQAAQQGKPGSRAPDAQ